jgi:flagellar basal-body rod protein FlgB
MAITDIPILAMLRTRLEWAQARQRVLAENVANADTPSFKPQDLTPPKFETPDRMALAPVSPVVLATTEPGHIGGIGDASPNGNDGSYQSHSTGDTVNIEDEMMKVAANQMDYEAASAVYTRSINLLKMALGNSSGQ